MGGSQVALCATHDDELKNKTERALLKARISYLMKCEKRLEQEEQSKKVVFYIQQYQMQEALEVVRELEKEETGLEILS